MACGIAALDRLWTDAAAPPIAPTDRDSVAAVQSLLLGHGFSGMPTLLSRSCGIYGPQTITALQTFQSAQDLNASGIIDRATLKALATVPAKTPVASTAYTAFVLQLDTTGLLRPATITMQFEGGGRFAASNLNTDGAGLSFGLIQWAQKPGRLHEVLDAFQHADQALYTKIFGDGDSGLAQGLLTHTGGINGGVDPVTGETKDPRFDLTDDAWQHRFQAAGREPAFQRAQITTALTAFGVSAQRIQKTMPMVKSERGLVFMLDVANQFGDAGAQSVVSKVAKTLKAGAGELDFLAAVGGETVARIGRQFGPASKEAQSTSNRREIIRTSPLLADSPANFS
jgi:peptidoglycan hydrolase-like protein with peptidoglycan-binding domain